MIRRAAIVSVSFDHLNDMMMMPDDMLITHIEVDHALVRLSLVVIHPHLEPIKDGDQLPTLIPAVTEYARVTDWGFERVRRGVQP